MNSDNSDVIGVFDTGRGGEIVAAKLRPLFPTLQFQTADDRPHAPYGQRSEDEIKELSVEAVRPLVKAGCNPIIIACNTATTIAIAQLRETFPQVEFIGMEPMIKPAAEQTQTKSIAILATPATLQSKRYQELVDSFASDITILQPDCSNWARLIEAGQLGDLDLPTATQQISNANCDQVVLACTHYLAVTDQLQGLLPASITIQDPIPPIARRLTQLLDKA